MTTATAEPLVSDPLLALEPFPYRRVFHPLGFAVEIETNSTEILDAAHTSWGGHMPSPGSHPLLRLRLGLTATGAGDCPPAANFRAFGNLLSIIADQENFIVCDLQQGTAFGWVNQAAIADRSYLRYHFLEAAILCLLSGSRVTPIHAACVTRNGCGLLFCGDSGAGKSTLAYACARAGFTFTSDDASYLLWHQTTPRVRGNAHQLRFRPSARELFPELEGRELTPRTEGKPSIEVPTSELDRLRIAPESAVHALILINRQTSPNVELRRVPRAVIRPYLEFSLFPLEGIRELQLAALTPLLDLPRYELRYRDLDTAIACLEQLTEQKTNR